MPICWYVNSCICSTIRQDRRLHTSTIDLIIRRICGRADLIDFGQFLEALVQVALTRYPSEPDSSSALLRLYRDKLDRFCAPDRVFNEVEVDKKYLSLAKACQDNLIGLYKVYYPFEVNSNFRIKDALSQAATLELFQDYDVGPTLVSKAVVLQGYRDIITATYLQTITEVEIPVLGRHFSYHHFVLLLLWVARQAFPSPSENDVLKAIALFTHMESSNGRVAARMKPNVAGLVPNRLLTREAKRMVVPASPRDRGRISRSSEAEFSGNNSEILSHIYGWLMDDAEWDFNTFIIFLRDIGVADENHDWKSLFTEFADRHPADPVSHLSITGFVKLNSRLLSWDNAYWDSHLYPAYINMLRVRRPETDLDIGASVVGEPELTAAIAAADKGIEAVFKKYAGAQEMGKENFMRFLSDFGVSPLIPEQVPIDIFDKCKSSEFSLKREGFRLALVLLSNRVMDGEELRERLVKLFHFLNLAEVAASISKPPLFVIRPKPLHSI